MKEIENHNTLVFIVSRRANKPQVCAIVAKLREGRALTPQDPTRRRCLDRPLQKARVVLNIRHHSFPHPQVKLAVKELYDVKVIKVNTLIRPDGRKKAFVRLSPDHDAVEVANKVRVGHVAALCAQILPPFLLKCGPHTHAPMIICRCVSFTQLIVLPPPSRRSVLSKCFSSTSPFIKNFLGCISLLVRVQDTL